MKQKLFALFAALCLCTSIGMAQKSNIIRPLPHGLNLTHLSNAKVAAEFTSADFNWVDRTLSMTIYSEALYDAVAIRNLRVGSVIFYDGRNVTVRSISRVYGNISINGGYLEDGLDLMPHEGGTYRPVVDDGYSIYTKLGRVTLPLADNFTLEDCGDQPSDPFTVVTSRHQQYFMSVPEWRQEFGSGNTTAVIQNGKVAKITRIWTP